MRIARRPSKFALWRFLEPDLGAAEGAVGLDAACAAFKMYPYFRTRTYIGVDVDLAAIEQGRREHPAGIGLHADLASLELPARSVDVCVSTNTFHWIPVDERLNALERLVGVVKSDGWLIVEVPAPFAPQAIALLRSEFTDVDVRYFGNPLSLRYERWLDAHAYLERGRGVLAVIRIAVASVLGAGELLFPHSPRGKSWAYFRCRRRRQAGPTAELQLDELRRVDDGIYATG